MTQPATSASLLSLSTSPSIVGVTSAGASKRQQALHTAKTLQTDCLHSTKTAHHTSEETGGGKRGLAKGGVVGAGGYRGDGGMFARHATFLLPIPTSAPDLPSHGEAPQEDHVGLHKRANLSAHRISCTTWLRYSRTQATLCRQATFEHPWSPVPMAGRNQYGSITPAFSGSPWRGEINLVRIGCGGNEQKMDENRGNVCPARTRHAPGALPFY